MATMPLSTVYVLSTVDQTSPIVIVSRRARLRSPNHESLKLPAIKSLVLQTLLPELAYQLLITMSVHAPPTRELMVRSELEENPVIAEHNKIICKHDRSLFVRIFRKVIEAFTPLGPDPGTILLRDLRHISPVALFHLLPTLSERLILLDLRSRYELDCFPFAICDSLQTADLDWEALLHSVPPRNVVILYGSNDESVAYMTIASLPKGLDVLNLRGGLQEWCETGLPLNQVAVESLALKVRSSSGHVD
jgi:hypothetical protein